MRLKHLAPVLAVGVLTGLSPALTAGPAAAAGGTPAALSPGQALDWRACDLPPDPDYPTPAGTRCATVTVPLDHRKPEGKKIALEVARIPAAKPTERLGSLFLNPGGPGGEAVRTAPVLDAFVPDAVKDRYDRIAFDPRGVGLSTPLACGLTPEQRPGLHPYSKTGFDRAVALNRDFAAKCRAKHGDDLLQFTTRNTARDVDLIRAALGEEKTHYLGYSYGSYLGAVYTQMFPQRAGRIVLDSAVDPKEAWRGQWRAWGPETHRQFERWARWAARHPDTHRLGDTPAKVRASFWKLIAAADRAPLRLEGGSLDGDGVREALWSSFDTVRSATVVVDNLRQVAAGRPAGEFPPGTLPILGEWPDPGASAAWSVLCNDASWSKDPESYRTQARRDKARYPLYGDYASSITPCAFWKDPVEPTTRVDNTVGALIVQNEWDAQTPLKQARGMRADLKGSRMVVVAGGEDHGVYGAGRSACADGVTTRYLLTGKLPAGDVTCQADPAPRRATVPQGTDPVLPFTR
ncbi:alpha/beta hydrolase [Streptomyces sp. NPDC049906]|uniref:alpha/beta hydrolase n=1 Tax=Streptomyces sp. NPDC049906 TaxID=3155656 RepID=UPI00344993AD